MENYYTRALKKKKLQACLVPWKWIRNEGWGPYFLVGLVTGSLSAEEGQTQKSPSDFYSGFLECRVHFLIRNANLYACFITHGSVIFHNMSLAEFPTSISALFFFKLLSHLKPQDKSNFNICANVMCCNWALWFCLVYFYFIKKIVGKVSKDSSYNTTQIWYVRTLPGFQRKALTGNSLVSLFSKTKYHLSSKPTLVSRPSRFSFHFIFFTAIWCFGALDKTITCLLCIPGWVNRFYPPEKAISPVEDMKSQSDKSMRQMIQSRLSSHRCKLMLSWHIHTQQHKETFILSRNTHWQTSRTLNRLKMTNKQGDRISDAVVIYM